MVQRKQLTVSGVKTADLRESAPAGASGYIVRGNIDRLSAVIAVLDFHKARVAELEAQLKSLREKQQSCLSPIEPLGSLPGLGPRTLNALTSAGIVTIASLLRCRRCDLERMRNIGPDTLRHLRDVLSRNGFLPGF